MRRLTGKTAIITGAGQGIGRGIARRFAAEGAAVVVAERDAGLGQTVADELTRECGARAVCVATDVTDKAQIAAMVDATIAAFGRVDVLVNNAWGGGSFCRLEHKTDEEMQHGVRLGYMAPFWMMQAAFPHLKQRGGSIVTLCSLNGVNAHMYSLEYNGAKEAARALTRTAAREWARHGIRANVICPAAATEAYEAFRTMAPDNAAELLKQNPMGRMGDPEEDIAPVAVFLASEGSRYLTGNTLFVDGGSHVNGVAWAPELPD